MGAVVLQIGKEGMGHVRMQMKGEERGEKEDRKGKNMIKQ